MSLFWRVFGGTILSIAALGSITLYNSISTNISELRSELNRERDARAELVKKDEFNSRTSNQYERIRSFDGLKAEHEAMKERLSANAAMLDGMKKEFAPTVDAVKKDAAALEVLKERLAALEVVKKEIAGIDLIKERLTAIATDLKSSRDDLAKLQQEVERNRAGDVERKTSRDGQFKQVEETLKELQKGLQVCREKLARLEGVQPGGPARSPLLPMGVPALQDRQLRAAGRGPMNFTLRAARLQWPHGTAQQIPGPRGRRFAALLRHPHRRRAREGRRRAGQRPRPAASTPRPIRSPLTTTRSGPRSSSTGWSTSRSAISARTTIPAGGPVPWICCRTSNSASTPSAGSTRAARASCS